jgi:hypothetical protein
MLSQILAELHAESTSELVSHLDECDFCAAEAYFFSRVQLGSANYTPEKIPPQLRLLAESLLHKRAPTI